MGTIKRNQKMAAMNNNTCYVAVACMPCGLNNSVVLVVCLQAALQVMLFISAK